MSHSGIDTTSAISASTVAPSERSTLPKKEAPFFCSSVGKRRSATSLVSAGAMKPATMSSDSTTISGVTPNTTTSGASAAVTSLEKRRPIQAQKLDSSGQASRASRVQATATSQ
ncbi:hypothetical protein D3C72_774820 [compost metagenome]